LNLKTNKINVGVIGVGLMGENHLSAYVDNPFTNVTCIADVDENRAREVAGKYALKRYYKDYAEMLENEDLQAISIATPEGYHAGPAVDAAKRGIHILCEKPIAGAMDDALAITKACELNNVKLLIGYTSRFETKYSMAKENIKLGKIGDINLIRSHRTDSVSIAKRVSKWTNLVSYDAVHDIDLILWYSESDVIRVYAEGSSKLLGDDGPDAMQATLTLANGAVGSITTNWIVPDKKPTTFEQETEICGTKGVIKIDVENQELQINATDGTTYPDTTFYPTVDGHIAGAFRREIQHFVNCIRADKMPIISGSDGVATLKVALAIRESYKKHEIITL
jgi:predicted dehydrogenase